MSVAMVVDIAGPIDAISRHEIIDRVVNSWDTFITIWCGFNLSQIELPRIIPDTDFYQNGAGTAAVMPLDYDQLLSDFKVMWENEDRPNKVEYHADGEMHVEKDTEFSTISTVIQDRGHVRKDELLAMGRWKVEGKRIERHLEENAPQDVESVTREALDTTDGATAADTLTNLTGVGVPVASTILAMSDPREYAIVDYRSFRALAAAVPELIDTDSYGELVEFLEHFRTYNDVDSYDYYIRHVREIANREGLTPRQVDMALWALDKNRS